VASCTRRLDPRAVADTIEELGASDLTGRFLGAFTQLGRTAWRAAPTRSGAESPGGGA
jgi:hypothetical protein